MSGREVHQLSHRERVEGIRQTLRELAAAGIVAVERRPGISLFRLNREHLMAPALLSLLTARKELVARITALLEGWPLPLRHASVFGSAARADGDVGSDVDLVLVAVSEQDAASPAWRAATDHLVEQVQRWSGNSAHVITVEPGQLAAMIEGQDPLVESWRGEARRLVGVPVSRWPT